MQSSSGPHHPVAVSLRIFRSPNRSPWIGVPLDRSIAPRPDSTLGTAWGRKDPFTSGRWLAPAANALAARSASALAERKVESHFSVYGAAKESNLPTAGLRRPAGFEDRIGHQTAAAPGAESRVWIVVRGNAGGNTPRARRIQATREALYEDESRTAPTRPSIDFQPAEPERLSTGLDTGTEASSRRGGSTS
jgi:hypothetical protein